MTELRRDLPPLPRRFRSLPLDDRGYPIPWFVATIDGKPDFRVVKPRAIHEAVLGHKCWLCGDVLGRNGAFVIGPMCAINQISSEPPSHRECAEFAVKACPFLVRPAAKRRDAALPEDASVAGEMIPRNPGVSLLWVSRDWRPVKADGGSGVLIQVGRPIEVQWWREGRAATRAEIMESIDSGYPILLEAAERDRRRGHASAVRELERCRDNALKLLPAA